MLFEGSAAHRARPSFPTRRSSDLGTATVARPLQIALGSIPIDRNMAMATRALATLNRPGIATSATSFSPPGPSATRSEEHTSELQSRENLVCRLLLEKKNKARHAD